MTTLELRFALLPRRVIFFSLLRESVCVFFLLAVALEALAREFGFKLILPYFLRAYQIFNADRGLFDVDRFALIE